MVDEQTVSGRLASLRAEVREVRASILDMLMSMDHLRLQVIPQVMADYQLKIGCWEKALFEVVLEGRRAKRRLALLQIQANRGEPLDDDAVEVQLAKELSAWEAKVKQARMAYERAMARLSSYKPMSDADSKKLKHVYRTLVRRLHPDVCRAKGEGTSTLFKLAQAAYEAGDLEMLSSLEVATRNLEMEDDLEGVVDVAALEQELELARIEEGVVRGQLEELKGCKELRLMELLADPDWVVAQVTTLREAVGRWEAVIKDCAAKERELRRGYDGS